VSSLSELTLAQVSAEFPTERSAHDYFVSVRWPNGVRCAHCGSTRVHDARAKRNRPIWKCDDPDCRKQFSVTTGTVMESTKLPLRTWLLGWYMLSAHKRSVSSHQLHRDLGISLPSAWFMSQRIRAAMRDTDAEPLYGTVEADITYLGGRRRRFGRGYTGNKIPVHGVASRSSGSKRDGKPIRKGPHRYIPGRVRFMAMHRGTDPNRKMLGDQLTDVAIPDESVLMTDETPLYDVVGKRFVDHQKVNHSVGEYVRGDVTTNTIEGVFAGLKRQITGTHHSISAQHAQKYLDEHAFKYNHRDETDGERFVRAVRSGANASKRVRLFQPSSGKAPALRKRTVDGPAVEPWKRPRYLYGLSPLARRYGRRRAMAKRAGQLREALARIAEKQEQENGDGEGGGGKGA
jgi:transposase-like protein